MLACVLACVGARAGVFVHGQQSPSEGRDDKSVTINDVTERVMTGRKVTYQNDVQARTRRGAYGM